MKEELEKMATEPNIDYPLNSNEVIALELAEAKEKKLAAMLGKNAGTEIEITSEMIEAGANFLDAQLDGLVNLDRYTLEVLVRGVFEEGARVSRLERRKA
jgi:hypothetical protein